MDLIEELSKVRGARFVNLTYRAKETQELARYSIVLGVSLEKAYKRDERVMDSIRPLSDLEGKAKEEILNSLRESLRKGIGNNSGYTCRGVFNQLFPGVKYHAETKETYLYGFIVKKEVLEPGEYRETQSKPLTIAKNRLRRHMKISRFRQFSLNNINRIAFDGKVLDLA